MNNDPKNKIDPMLVLAVIIFFLAGCVYAVLLYKTGTSNPPIPKQIDVIPDAPTSTASTTLTQPSTTTPVVERTIENALPSGSSTSTTSNQNSVTTNTSECTASGLDGSASLLPSTNGTVFGTLRINNRESSSCQLAGSASVSLLSGSGTLPITQGPSSKPSVVIPSKGSVNVNFVWSNWCSTTASAPLQIKFSLPGNAGYLQLPAISPAGSPQSIYPACTSTSQPSTVTVQ